MVVAGGFRLFGWGLFGSLGNCLLNAFVVTLVWLRPGLPTRLWLERGLNFCERGIARSCQFQLIRQRQGDDDGKCSDDWRGPAQGIELSIAVMEPDGRSGPSE